MIPLLWHNTMIYFSTVSKSCIEIEYKLFVKTKPCRKRRRKGPGELASMDPLLFLFIYGAAVQRDGAKRNRAAALLGVPAPTVSDIQGAAVQRDGTKQNRAAAWLDAAEKNTAALCQRTGSSGAYFRMTASATFIPSIAADVMPPAYPAPSPHG